MPDKEIPEFNGGTEDVNPADTAKIPHQTAVGNPARFTAWGTFKSLLAALFAGKTYESELSDTTPAAPTGAVNVHFQEDASSPKNVSAHVIADEIEVLIEHDNLAGVSSDEHVPHSSITVSVGPGLALNGVVEGSDTIDGNIAITVSGAVGSSVIYVGKGGDDANDGTSPDAPKLTIGAGITAAAAIVTGGAPSASVVVIDAGQYTENLTVTAGLRLHAPTATLIGTLSLADDSSAKLWRHYNAAGSTTAVTKTGASGRAFYEAEILDTRGTGGALTGNTGIQNATSGGVMFAKVGVLYVSESGFGIQDSGAGFGHLHFWAADLYLAGNSATGIRAQTANSNIIGYIDHILETGSPTSTVGIAVSNASAIVKATITEIIADTVYNISNGSLHLVCSKATGARSGTPVFELSDQFVKATNFFPSAANGFVSAGEMIPATTSGAAAVTEETTTNKLNVDAFDFDPATAESVYWVTAIPSWFSFTTFTARAVWKDNGTVGTGGVVFEISARVFSEAETLDQALGSVVQINDSIGTGGHVKISDVSGTCTPAGGTVAENDYLVVKIARNPADTEDTYTEDARLLGIILAFS